MLLYLVKFVHLKTLYFGLNIKNEIQKKYFEFVKLRPNKVFVDSEILIVSVKPKYKFYWKSIFLLQAHFWPKKAKKRKKMSPILKHLVCSYFSTYNKNKSTLTFVHAISLPLHHILIENLTDCFDIYRFWTVDRFTSESGGHFGITSSLVGSTILCLCWIIFKVLCVHYWWLIDH